MRFLWLTLIEINKLKNWRHHTLTTAIKGGFREKICLKSNTFASLVRKNDIIAFLFL